MTPNEREAALDLLDHLERQVQLNQNVSERSIDDPDVQTQARVQALLLSKCARVVRQAIILDELDVALEVTAED